MTMGPSRIALLALAALAAPLARETGGKVIVSDAPFDDEPPMPRPPRETREYPYYSARDGISARHSPEFGPGKRQGERLARQKAKGMLDFSASEKCLARIKARNEE